MEFIFFTAKKRVMKLQRAAQLTDNKPISQKRTFIVGGFEFPFLSKINDLPQPMEASYAVSFFEQKPIYNTQQQTCRGNGVVVGNFIPDEEKKANLKNSHTNIQARIRRLWNKINKAKDYKNWANWWKDFKWCDRNLNYKLKALGSINIQNFFHPSHPDKTTEEMMNQIMNSATVLKKKVYDPVKILHTIYMLMNETFLENLRNSEIEKLQDIILSIPNDWWVYEMRRFLFTWSEYYKIANSNEWKPTKTRNMTYEFIRSRWESPVFHWLAKQVILELKV